jgi:hypothetical protein
VLPAALRRIVTVGGSGVGEALLRRVIAAFPELRDQLTLRSEVVVDLVEGHNGRLGDPTRRQVRVATLEEAGPGRSDDRPGDDAFRSPASEAVGRLGREDGMGTRLAHHSPGRSTDQVAESGRRSMSRPAPQNAIRRS